MGTGDPGVTGRGDPGTVLMGRGDPRVGKGWKKKLPEVGVG